VPGGHLWEELTEARRECLIDVREIGDRVRLGLRRVVQLRLAHATERPGGDYEVGGAFDAALTSAELAALAGASASAS